MLELIATIFLAIGFIGMSAVAICKIPILRNAEKNDADSFFSFSVVKQKIQQDLTAKAEKFSQLDFWDTLLHKVISKIKVLALKTETKCNHLLEKTRGRSKRVKEHEKYWEKISKIASKKK